MSREWIKRSIESITTKLGDGLHGTPEYSDSGDYHFINGNNLLEGKIVFTEKTKRVDSSQYEKYKKDLNDRTILVSINGTIGNVAFYNGEKVVLGKSACYFNIEPRVCKGFVKYALVDRTFQGYIESFATGTTIKNVSLKTMRAYEINLPPLPEQKAIAHVLGALDDKIELNRQMNQTLEQMAQALFKSWFVDFDPVIDNALAAGNPIPEPLQARAERRKALQQNEAVTERSRSATTEQTVTSSGPAVAGLYRDRVTSSADPEGSVYRDAAQRTTPAQAPTERRRSAATESNKHNPLFPSSFTYSETLGKWIPEGWEVKRLSDLIDLIGGGTPKTSIEEYWNGSIPWFSVVDAPSESDVFVIDTEKHITEDGVSNSSTKILPVGTTIISARGTVGKCAMVGVPMAMNQSCYGVKSKKEGKDCFINLMLRKKVSDLQGKGHGSVFNTITRDTFDSIEVVVPIDGNLINKFEELVLGSFSKIKSNLFQTQSLTQLRDTLLPKLISGKLRLPEDFVKRFEGEV